MGYGNEPGAILFDKKSIYGHYVNIGKRMILQY